MPHPTCSCGNLAHRCVAALAASSQPRGTVAQYFPKVLVFLNNEGSDRYNRYQFTISLSSNDQRMDHHTPYIRVLLTNDLVHYNTMTNGDFSDIHNTKGVILKGLV